MHGDKAYLEASHRTQDLLNIKWALRSVGYSIGSSWHDTEANTGTAFKDHWNARGLEQLQFCDCLIVISGTRGEAAPELAMMAGFALARGIRLFWIGAPFRGLSDFRAATQFDSAESFQKELLSTAHSKPVWASKQQAA